MNWLWDRKLLNRFCPIILDFQVSKALSDCARDAAFSFSLLKVSVIESLRCHWYNCLVLEIKRLFREKLERAAFDFPVVVLTGARQVGKTTLLRDLFPKHHYVSLDLPSMAQLAEQDPEGFLKRFPAPLLIDEAQYAPKIFRHLKWIVDQDRHKMAQFILTGSQKFTLMKEVSDSLAGRAAVFELEGLSIEEIETVYDLKADLDHLTQGLIRGSFPELWRNQKASESTFFESYLVTYIERDLQQIIQISKVRDFERLVRLCALRTGQLLNKSDLARDLGISVTTVNEWVNALEVSNIIFFLEPWSTHLGKRLSKTPKLYFGDVGLATWLMGLDSGSLLKADQIGFLWETWVYSEMRKWKALQNRREEIFYYRDVHQTEVDFIVVSGSQVRFVECKWTQNPPRKVAEPLKKLAQLFSLHPSTRALQQRSAVICRTTHSFPLEGEVRAESIFDLRKNVLDWA
jgi:predicted AAA+ superfamily ATPase